MKTTSKTKVMLVLALLAFSTNLFAQGPEVNSKFINQVKTNTLESLKSDYNSIVESTMYVLLQLKNRYPEGDYGRLVSKLNELAVEGSTPAIRYKAQLTSLYYNFYNMFNGIDIVEKDPDMYFKLIAERLETNTLASN